MVALKQLEAQLCCAVLQLLGATELWLHVCSPTANPLNVKHTHVPLLRHLEASFLQAAPSVLDTE